MILLAEDDQDDRDIFDETFSELGNSAIRLESVEDGIDLINRLKEIKNDDELPHLFILDQNMPKMTGKATLAYLKAHDRYKNIPVIIYSTYPDSSLVSEFVNLGAEEVVTKPDSFDGFKDMENGFIRTYIQKNTVSL
ncbi:MAG TPA: response regulator [Sphingobacteriaceae bacterium]